MSTPTLGERITFTHILHRRMEGTDPRQPLRKIWEPRPTSYEVPGTDRLDGIVVGVRTLWDGHFHRSPGGMWESAEERFVNDRHFTAYLVAYDVRRKPVYVLPEHTSIEGEVVQ